ncbi:MAG: thymidine phosphorylase [Armatimonadetes bacterium]|nr:thymidine phosphorylase [Armatimonadota bacterium]
MTIQHFLTAKRDGRRHSPGDLRWFVRELVAGRVADYQAAAWLTAAFLNGLDEDETTELTLAMAESSEQPDLGSLPRPLVDKHSTGGVGDSVSIILLPLLAACGLTVVKMSGRGLGFTGGTLDKLGAIPGFRTGLSPEEMTEIARSVGCALAGQSANLAPADKILYALRDATETVDSVPLIAASVMSKKLAAGADVIVLDVKCGSGAFTPDPERARELASAMVAIGERAGRRMKALITDMSQPLAPAVGNALEVRAAINELKTGCKGRLGRVTRALAQAAAEAAGTEFDVGRAIDSGLALEKMREWIAAQGGDARVVDEPDALLPRAPVIKKVGSPADGFVGSFQTAAIGETARGLGAGRRRKEDEIDPAVGLEVHLQIGDRVSAGRPVFTIHAQTESAASNAAAELPALVSISDNAVSPPEIILEGG